MLIYNKKRFYKISSFLLCFVMILSSAVFVFANDTDLDSQQIQVATLEVASLQQNSTIDSNVHELVIMGTTDIHAYIMPYDYMTATGDRNYGLSRIATLVDQIRAQYNNTLLFDAGDTIQGSLLGSMDAMIKPLKDGQVHSVIGSMNMMNYDAAIIGNHEFNFGLEFLHRAYRDAKFPVVNANIYKAGTDENYFTPYVILDREVDGKPIRIGVIGFVPPQVMIWDKLNLEGRVEAREIVETAEKFVPIMRAEGADIIVAVAHTGIEVTNNTSENAAFYLSQVPGIDAMVLGHQHKRFPSVDYKDIEGIDIEKGTVNGVPTIMPGSWGNNLGKIKLSLTFDNGKWEIVGSQSILTAVDTDFQPRQDIVDFVQDRHEATIEYVKTPVGETSVELNTIFSRVTDNKAVQLINDAQLWFVENYLNNFVGTEFEGLPILSAAAPFLAGRRGPDNFTVVPKGGVAVRDVANLYIFDNTFQMVKVNGAQLMAWLERNADNFNQIDPTSPEDQILLDYNFRGFNFDHITGIYYNYDVTKPRGERVVNLTFNGHPITEDMEFLVATNNYRASGGGDHLRDVVIAYSGTEENRAIIIDYIREKQVLSPQLTNNWSILPVETVGRVLFRSSPLGKDYIEAVGISNISYVAEEDHWGIYQIDLSYEKAITRGEFTKMIVEAFNLEAKAGRIFDDTANHWAKNYIATAQAYGIINGYNDTTFGADDLITREQMIVMVIRAANLKSAAVEITFTDKAFISNWAMEAVSTAIARGMIVGCQDSTFRPQDNAKRGEAVRVILQALK